MTDEEKRLKGLFEEMLELIDECIDHDTTSPYNTLTWMTERVKFDINKALAIACDALGIEVNNDD